MDLLHDKTLGVPEVARRLGMTVLALRHGIRTGVYPFGVAYKKEGGRRTTFKISEARLNNYLKGGGGDAVTIDNGPGAEMDHG